MLVGSVVGVVGVVVAVGVPVGVVSAANVVEGT